MIFLSLIATSFIGLSQQAVCRIKTNNLPTLKFDENGHFNITVFSDMHFGSCKTPTGNPYSSNCTNFKDPWLPHGDLEDEKTVEVMSSILDYDRPDLVVLNGDLINGDGTFAENSTHYVDRIVKPMVDRRLTWASAYGNHDHQLNLSAVDVLKREKLWPGARTKNMVPGPGAGVTNYYLPVYAPDCIVTNGYEHCTPELLLWFFDSRGGYYHNSIQKNRTHQPNWVHESVTKWFVATNEELTKTYRRSVPSLAFVHIPIKVTDDVQPLWDSKHNPGINDEIGIAMQGQGWCPDGRHDWPNCRYSGQDIAFMQALSNTPGMMGLFYGHDHGNTWCYKWNSTMAGVDAPKNDINLCFGQHTGYSGYGDWIRGARQILLTLNELKSGIFRSQILLESGDVVGSITLNSTFNVDEYPVTPNEKTYLDRSENK